jgi:hypothetical protein
MSKTRAELFEEHIPSLTEADLEAAGASKVVLSFETLPVHAEPAEASMLGIRFVLDDGGQPTLLLDRFACQLLHQTIERLNASNWRASPAGRLGPKMH